MLSFGLGLSGCCQHEFTIRNLQFIASVVRKHASSEACCIQNIRNHLKPFSNTSSISPPRTMGSRALRLPFSWLATTPSTALNHKSIVQEEHLTSEIEKPVSMAPLSTQQIEPLHLAPSLQSLVPQQLAFCMFYPPGFVRRLYKWLLATRRRNVCYIVRNNAFELWFDCHYRELWIPFLLSHARSMTTSTMIIFTTIITAANVVAIIGLSALKGLAVGILGACSSLCGIGSNLLHCDSRSSNLWLFEI